MVIDFDPNSKPIKQYAWATYIRCRRPQFKIYHTLSHAKQSLYRHHSDMALYRLDDDDKWQEVISYSPPEETGYSAIQDWFCEREQVFRTFRDQLSKIKA